MLLSAEDLKLIREACRRVLERRGLSAAGVWLFGSRVTGKHVVRADLDVFVELPVSLSPRERAELEEELAAELEWELEVQADVVVADRGKKLPAGFVERVKREGVRLC